MSRLKQLTREEMTPEQRRIADEIMSGPRGGSTGLQGPFNAWMRSPGLCEHAQKVGAYCRFGSSLPDRLSEIAILVTGRHWRSNFEFWAHVRLAKKAGIADAKIEAIHAGRRPEGMAEDEAAVHDLAKELLETRRVSDANYQRAKTLFGESGVVDIVGIVGYYSLVALTLNTVRQPVPEGETAPFEP
jgi:4-carboxymuconolactone decarboxylase